MYTTNRARSLIAVVGWLLLAGGANPALAQQRIGTPSNVQTGETPDTRAPRPHPQKSNTGELPPALLTEQVSSDEQHAEAGSPRDGEVGACCAGPAGEPPYEPYECIGDMSSEDCLEIGEETVWFGDESCEAVPPYECGAPTYCPAYGQGYYWYIENVYLPHDAGIVDNSSGQGYYEDYTDIVAVMSTTLSYDLTVAANYTTTNRFIGVWIDWNQDKDWADAGETIWSSPLNEWTMTHEITVPPTALPGHTRMRIRIQIGDALDPCGTTAWGGEVEDYTILVSDEISTGSCCDPYTSVCTDDVEAADCQPPLEFRLRQTCADLDPPCGNPGACCDIHTGDCTDDVLELHCPEGSRFKGGEQCADLEPECGTPGACCVEHLGTCTIEFEANCVGRFAAGAACSPDPFTPPCGEITPSGMLYAPSNPDNPYFREEISEILGAPCDYFDARAGTPTLADLLPYSTVFTWTNYPYADKVAMGDVLADYADASASCYRERKVILGQWCFHSDQGNWLEGRIMEPGYCPVTTSTGSAHGSYSGDGSYYFFWEVYYLSASYLDVASLRPGAWSDGTFDTGDLAVAYRFDHSVYYSPGNTGGTFDFGDWAQLTANMTSCGAAGVLGACCDTETGECADCVDMTQCLDWFERPQFTYDQPCDTLDPPCGSAGACCINTEPYCFDDILEAECTGTFLGSGTHCGSDCDNDGKPDVCEPEYRDISLFLAQLLADVPAPVFVCMFDQNGDEILNGADIQGFVERLMRAQ